MGQTWKWYGDSDPVSLSDIKQAGATDIVTALHHVKNGQVWQIEDILDRKKTIERMGMNGSVVESIPVHEEIKMCSRNYAKWIENYKQSIINLTTCGIDTVCYNLMVVLDWTSTDIESEIAEGSTSFRFDQVAFPAFELCILKCPSAEDDDSRNDKQDAANYFNNMSEQQIDLLTVNIIVALPSAKEGHPLTEFQAQLHSDQNINKDVLPENLPAFLHEIVPVCEQYGLKLAIHPGDPAHPILGLPRVVSTIEDIDWLTKAVPSMANGITMCTGSYGVCDENNLVKIINQHGDPIDFTHLRSTQREDNSLSFHEVAHAYKNSIIYQSLKYNSTQKQKRLSSARSRLIPLRPDQGHQMIDDLHQQTNPGDSCIGRLKCLAEIRGGAGTRYKKSTV
ncbi:MAG: mannonate dehydratase [Colwellia sp.]